MDLTNERVPGDALSLPIDFTLPVNKVVEGAAVRAIASALKDSKKPCILIDHLVHSYGRLQAQRLVDKLNLPVYAAHMGKGCTDETHPSFVGMYNASLSFQGIAEAFESSDLCLALGWWPSDSNSCAFSREMPDERRIDVMDDHVIVSLHRYRCQACHLSVHMVDSN